MSPRVRTMLIVASTLSALTALAFGTVSALTMGPGLVSERTASASVLWLIAVGVFAAAATFPEDS
jgi:hypothetical protein